jgi:hypothetical protein
LTGTFLGGVGGFGGSEDQSWNHQTYLPFVRFAALGSRDASSVKIGYLNQNTSGRSEFLLNWPRTIATSRCSTWQSTAGCGVAFGEDESR